MKTDNKRIYKVNEREEFFEKLPFKKVSEKSLEKAIMLSCPYSMEVIRVKNRKEDVKEWRSAIMLLKWLNGAKTGESTDYVNRHHSTLLHHIKNIRNEFDTCDFRIVEKMRLIIKYCDANPRCNEITFNLKELL